jgi:mono/diheme cytochrome c family protein
MFMSYCASCHGKNAKGDGPAAGALKQAPADLTTLAKQNGGKYPSDLVTSVLRGQTKLIAHGDQDMPVWGPVFWKMSQGHEEQVQMRIANLNHYIESLQAK